MSERARSLATQLRDAGAALIRCVENIDATHWERVPDTGVWSAGKDAEHVTQGAGYHQWLVRTAALGETSERGPVTQRDVMTAKLSRADVLTDLHARTEANAQLVESLSDAQLGLPAPPLGPAGAPRTVEQLIDGQMIRHYREHLWNISTKLREHASVGPSQVDLLGWLDSLSNWGRWGAEDQRGTLNLVTPEVTLRATRLVQEGVTVSCARPWSYEAAPDVDARRVPQHYMIASGEAYRPGEGPDRQVALDFVGVAFHGRTVTHIDSLAHFFWDGRLFNGASSRLVRSMDGATSHSVANASGGIITRGILIDAPWLRGRDVVEPGDGVGLAELEAARERCGIEPEPGDVLLLRTGQLGRRDRVGPLAADAGSAGPLPELLPTLRQRDVAVLGSDTGNDVQPSGFERFSNPVHQVGIVGLGLWILDNAWLDDLAQACRARQRWQFLISILPLRIPNATGSPVNPVAIF